MEFMDIIIIMYYYATSDTYANSQASMHRVNVAMYFPSTA